MNGIERAREFYRSRVQPMLEHRFSAVAGRIAAGIAGRGSECFGFDDEISRDHDSLTGVTLWISEADDREFGFELTRAYNDLTKDFPDVRRSSLGYSEFGVCTIEDFFCRHLGFPGAPRGWQEWLYTPEYAFAESTNGKVFSDNEGTFTRIRNTILYDLPEDVRLKKIAARIIAMAQSGQYNFERCLKHGEPGAAAVALHEFVRNAVSLIFLLNFRFAPYYKWQFRALKALPFMGEEGHTLETLLTRELPSPEKSAMVENFCAKIAAHLRGSGLTETKESYLEPHAFEVMKRIRSAQLRGLHVMEG